MREYQVAVTNKSTEPVTVWLTKNGPPVEKLWLAPEQVAFMTREKDDSVQGAWLEPGKTAEIGPIGGKFEVGSDAVLRVYRGRLKIAQIIAVSPDSALRQDLTLKPGPNNLTVTPKETVPQ